MKKQLTFISILMVIIIAALTLGGLQLFGRGKAKPSEWFGKEEKTIGANLARNGKLCKFCVVGGK